MDVTIPLSRGLSTIVDAEVFESERVYYRRDGEELHVRPCNLNWRAAKNRNFQYASAYIYVSRWTVPLHRLLLSAPRFEMVDHIDRDTLNNRLTNLRLCSHSGNMANTQPRGGASRFKGVKRNKYRKGWWVAQIHRTLASGAHRCDWLGSFATEEAAARAYDARALELFGEFALTNFPPEPPSPRVAKLQIERIV